MQYLSCREIIDHLDSYHAGDMVAGIRVEFERHLAVCPPCVDYLRTYRETIRLSRECFEQGNPELPPGMPEDLVKAILASRTAGSQRDS